MEMREGPCEQPHFNGYPTSTRHQTDLKGFETGDLPVEYVK